MDSTVYNQRIRMPNRGPLSLPLLLLLLLNYFIAFNLTIEAKHFLVETEDGSEMLTEEQTNAMLGALPDQHKEEYESLDKATQQKLQRKLYKMLGEPDWERPLSKADSDELTKRVRSALILWLWLFVTTICETNHLQIEEAAKDEDIINLVNNEM